MDLKDLIERETGQRFNKSGFICCPFHNEKTPSFKVKRYNDKDRYYCFGCGAKGDNIDFVKNYKNMTYIEACNYLGIELDANQKEIYTNFEKVENIAKKTKDLTFIKLYSFTGSDNKILYYKAKFKDNEGNKKYRYYHIKDDKIEYSRGCDEVPYNYYKLVNGLGKNRHIYIVEGEKDADTLSHYGYTATSFKGVTEFNYSIFKDAIVYIIPDNDETGDKYKESLYTNLKDYVKEFNVIRPESFRNSRKGYDITDWFEDNHDIEDFKREVKYSWDYKKSRIWKHVKVNKEGICTPLPVTDNVELLLDRENIKLKYNLIEKNIDVYINKTIKEFNNDVFITINDKCILNNFKINLQSLDNSLKLIASKNSYNPFIDKVKEHRNNNYSLIDEFFDCLIIDPNYSEYIPLYKTLFRKWLRGMIYQCQSTMDNLRASRGLLVLVGKQGIYKSRFFEGLIRDSRWYKGEASIQLNALGATRRDSIKQNTHYVLVELAEVMASANEKTDDYFKAFITTKIDEFRASHEKFDTKQPRVTTFCATCNNQHYLSDDTGNRRFWTVPVKSIDIDKMLTLNNYDMLGAIYNECVENLINPIEYFEDLSPEESKELEENNKNFMVETSPETELKEIIEEKFDFTQDRKYWRVYRLKDLKEALEYRFDKTIDLKEFFEKNYGYKYQSQLNVYDCKKICGIKLPNADKKQLEDFKKAATNSPFINNEPIQEEIKTKPLPTWNTARA